MLRNLMHVLYVMSSVAICLGFSLVQKTHKSLCPSATSNCGGLRPRIDSPVIQECCGLRPQQTVAASGGKIPYVFREMVTKIVFHLKL